MRPDIFYSTLAESKLFGTSLKQGVVDTLNIISDTYYAFYAPTADPDHLAYLYATAYHESYHAALNPQWAPVREGFARTNAGAIAAVARLRMEGKISENYALPQENGKSYYGRGWVQITWPQNYRRMGARLNLPLYDNPDLLLDPKVAAKALVVGSVEGLYTGKKLSDFDNIDGSFQAYNARRVINGKDKAEKIKDHYEVFLRAITGAVHG